MEVGTQEGNGVEVRALEVGFTQKGILQRVPLDGEEDLPRL